jgi:O-antigen ligase
VILIAIYLALLFIAPQLWVKPFVGIRVDFFLYPLWFLYVLLRGRIVHLLRFRAPDWLFLAFVLWNVLTLIAPGMPERGVKITTDCAKWFVLYRLTIASLAGMSGVRRACQLLVLFGLVLAVEGIQHFWSESGLGWAGQTFGWVDQSAGELGLDKRTRWINIFDGPGVFCVVYTIALPFLLHYLVFPFSWVTRFLSLVPTGLVMLAIFYTGSRGGYITTLVLVGAFVAVRIGLSPVKLSILGAVAVVGVMLGPSYITSTRDSSNSAQHRVEMWAQGIEMVQQNPLLGIGRGTFAAYSGSLIAHNSAIEIMGEAGLPGFFFWTALIYCAVKTLMRAIREHPDEKDRAYARALLLCIGGYLVSAMFVTLEYETFYFLLALAVASGEDLEAAPLFGAYDALAVAAIMLAFFVPLKIFVMMYF